MNTQRANCALSPNYEPVDPKSAAFPNKTLRGGILFRTEAGSKSARPPPHGVGEPRGMGGIQRDFLQGGCGCKIEGEFLRGSERRVAGWVYGEDDH